MMIAEGYNQKAGLMFCCSRACLQAAAVKQKAAAEEKARIGNALFEEIFTLQKSIKYNCAYVAACKHTKIDAAPGKYNTGFAERFATLMLPRFKQKDFYHLQAPHHKPFCCNWQYF